MRGPSARNEMSLTDEMIFHTEPEVSPLEVSAVMVSLIDAVTGALAERCQEQVALARVPPLLDQCLEDPALLTGQQRVFDKESYARHLVHVDPTGRFSILVVAWLPEQITPVHGHNAWGVVGVHAGVMENISYAVTEASSGESTYVASGTKKASAGHIAEVSAGDESAHQLRNPGPKPAFTIHVYGMDLSAESIGINRYYD